MSPWWTTIVEYAGHARDFAQSLDLNEWNGIIVASGDGLLYEVIDHVSVSSPSVLFKVINGLLKRRDWQNALKLPIGHLPCGSANAFVTNVVRHSQ